jgi:uncharacterized protein YjbI with pentapeptide repeats
VADDGNQQRKPDFRTAVDDVKAIAAVVAMEAESVLGKRPARILGVTALFAVVIGVLLALLTWYIAPTDPEQKQALVVTLAQILGGTALLSGLYFTWRTLQVNREGQITDRFTRAIEQLGKTNDAGDKLFEIRVGGIYALERIARESEEDYWTIMEILTAYVRQHAPRWLSGEGQEGTEDGATVEKKSKGVSRGNSETITASPPSPDIQAIINVLWRRKHSFRHGESEPLDLRDTNLSKANLTQTNLSGAILLGANLSNANLTDAFLTDANLTGADLTEADLSLATLVGATLAGAFNLTGTLRPSESIIPPENVTEFPAANLSGATLAGADLSGANLREANLSEASLLGANLSGADLAEADLSGAEFTQGWVRSGPLLGREFSGADFTGANLKRANLTGANVWGARGMTEDQIEWTIGSNDTILPEGFYRPELWSKSYEEQEEILRKRMFGTD